uniref:Kinetochore-associated protein-like protein n=1 Tax=Siphoviridae sp. ctwNf2 TaxID=2827597 RepID=A0A8S5RRE8_9CAUD|nr:MAG TPA: kinetochore-associated protein-like protein [Siphoviridae sp. ctwNf2]DAK42260.1 MAG TPA: Kinetochore-associated protein-like protein [Caudoviricetes sp.]
MNAGITCFYIVVLVLLDDKQQDYNVRCCSR